MRVGTKSLLFGVHSVIIHPTVVLIAWYSIYHTWPNWRELVCIIIHDWGYWGCSTMDGDDGSIHPIWAARKVLRRGWDLYYCALCLYHSRHLAKRYDKPVSKLYYADKLSFCYTPWWVYIPLGLLTGEIREYREQTDKVELTHPDWSWRAWYEAVSPAMRKLSEHPDNIQYLHP